MNNIDFQSYDSLLMQPLKPIPRTRKIHQVVAEGNVIHCRQMSCSCSEPRICRCFGPVTHVWDGIPRDSDVPVVAVHSSLAMLMEAKEEEPSKGPEGTATGLGSSDIQIEDWLAAMYDQHWWLAKALAADPDQGRILSSPWAKYPF